MTDLFWNLFEKSGNIDAFMAYKEFNRTEDKNIFENKYNNFGEKQKSDYNFGE